MSERKNQGKHNVTTPTDHIQKSQLRQQRREFQDPGERHLSHAKQRDHMPDEQGVGRGKGNRIAEEAGELAAVANRAVEMANGRGEETALQHGCPGGQGSDTARPHHHRGCKDQH